MELRLSVKTSEAKVLRSTVSQWNAKLVSEAENNGTLAIVCLLQKHWLKRCVTENMFQSANFFLCRFICFFNNPFRFFSGEHCHLYLIGRIS